MRHFLRFALMILPILAEGQAQLRPGFNAKEYLDLLEINASWPDSNGVMTRKPDIKYAFKYCSDEVGLRNKWSYWESADGVGVISIRGTIMKLESWLANVYCPMVPASGRIKLNDSTEFEYRFADDEKAAVHLGFTLAAGYLSKSVIRTIMDGYTNRHVKDFIVMGHSQGGGITYLMSSYLQYLQKKGGLPGDIRFKTYCSAAPKPGNLYFAYDYEFLTRDGWSYTVVNAADWVPEAGPTAQTLSDFNPVNPFSNLKPVFKKQKWPVNWYLNSVYNKMNRSVNGSRDRLEKYLGGTIGKMVKKSLPQYVEPEFSNTMNYMRAGTFIILQPDTEYRSIYPDDPQKIWTHHMFEPYAYLTRKQYMVPVGSGTK